MTNPFAVFSDFPYTPVVGLALAASCSIISVFIVLRKMAMLSEAIAHSSILGMALALLLGHLFPIIVDPHAGSTLQQVVIGFFCVLAALTVSHFTQGHHVSEDSAIGIVLVSTVALGIFLLDLNRRLPLVPGSPRPASLESILFGDILAVGPAEMWVALTVLGLVIVVTGAYYNEFVYTTLDPQMARINGVNTAFINVLQLCLISLVIDIGMRMVGGFMITAITILPGATAAMLSRKFNNVMLASFIIGVAGIGAGLTLAANEPLNRFTSGPILVLTLFVIFLVVWTLKRFFKPRVEALPAEATAEAAEAAA
jgi:ABC-type Mn2+/Zn2+ transport system permease subunit